MTSDFTDPSVYYNYYVKLLDEMITFGAYRLTYEPPDDGIETHIDMCISSEANVEQMLEFFKSFLMAAGYPVGFEDALILEIPNDGITNPDYPTIGDCMATCGPTAWGGAIGSDYAGYANF